MRDIGSLVRAQPPPSPRRRLPPAGQLMPKWLRNLVLFAASGVIVVPVAYAVVLALTPTAEFGGSQVLPSRWDWGNFAAIWSAVPLAQGFVNTMIIAGGAAALAVVIASCAAYPLAHYRYRGRRAVLYGILSVQIIPSPMILLPLFVIYAGVQTALGVTIIGSYWLLIVTYLTFALPFATWLMYSYMRSIPRELEAAALVDGASYLGALFRVILPVAAPGMVVAFVFSLLVGWNDVLFANVLTNTGTRTLAVVLQTFAFDQNGSVLPLYPELMAAGIVSAIPVVVAYLVLQKYLIAGLAKGGVK